MNKTQIINYTWRKSMPLRFVFVGAWNFFFGYVVFVGMFYFFKDVMPEYLILMISSIEVSLSS